MTDDHQLFIGGRWADGGPPLEVLNKYSGEVLGAVTTAREQDVYAAISAAAKGFDTMRRMPAYQRGELLLRTAQLLRENHDDFSRTIAAEAGKALKFSRAEVDRGISTFTIAAEEAKRIHGETVALDAVPAGEGYFGFYVRRPVGVVAAISPFNFPLNLVAHKVAPALAAGNSVVLKPASSTPLTAIKLCKVLESAGFPPGAINLVVGSGASVGEWLVTDQRVAKITFTGSPLVGDRITQIAGIKRVTLELGNTSPVVIGPDADLDFVAKRCAIGAYYNSGQVCISVQRIYGEEAIYESFTEKFVAASEAMVVGDPLDENVDVGPMIDLREAERIEAWVNEAQQGGAHVISGGKREGSVYRPTVLTNVKPDMRVVAEEAFAPVASVIQSYDFESALAEANRSEFGLQVGVFTRDIDRVIQAVESLDFGGIVINDTPVFRADHMPYGGNRLSGIGREGLKYAIEEMTNIRMVAIRSAT